jgi:hypothetical protein
MRRIFLVTAVVAAIGGWLAVPAFAGCSSPPPQCENGQPNNGANYGSSGSLKHFEAGLDCGFGYSPGEGHD